MKKAMIAVVGAFALALAVPSIASACGGSKPQQAKKVKKDKTKTAKSKAKSKKSKRQS